MAAQLSSNKTTIAPDYIPGFTNLFKECILGFIGLSTLFFLLQIPGQNMIPADEHCTIASNTYPPPCTRPSLFAFEGVCATVFILMTIISIKSWHIDQYPHKTLPQTPVGRVYGYSPQSQKIAALSFVFQLWSCFFTPHIPEFYSTIMMCHHIFAALVSFLALEYQVYHHYVVFFLALSEVSSVPLVFMSLGKYFPSVFGGILSVAQPLFALSFTFYRVYLWNKVSYNLWSDAWIVLEKKQGKNGSNIGTSIAEKYRPGKSFAIYVILTINVLLGLLQLFWFTKILVEIAKLLGIRVFDYNNNTDY